MTASARTIARRLGATLAIALCALAAPRHLWGQGMSSELIVGTITGDGGKPLEGANVEATATDGRITRKAVTNAKGRFSLVFPDGAGSYRLTVRAIGYQPITRQLTRNGDDDRIVANLTMSTQAVQLQELVTRARTQPQQRFERAAPGTSERVFDSDRAARLPTDASSLSALAALTPGVVVTSGTDSTAASISIAGQRGTANNTTVDGLSFGADNLPQDGLRNTRVITNTFDVSRGQFSGGQISVTTRSGTNVVQGSFTSIARERDLAIGTVSGNPFAQGTTSNQVSAGLGGPIVQDRLFFYLSGLARLNNNAFATLASADNTTLARLGVSPDSAARFQALVPTAAYGAGVVSPTANRDNNLYSALARFDWTLSDAHTLTLRGDWRNTSTDPARVGATSLPATGGTQSSSGGGVFAQVTSRFGEQLVNEVRGYWSRSDNAATPYLALPAARVQVFSSLPDGTQGVSSLGFGGNGGLPSSGRTTSFEGTDEVAWLSEDGSHRVKLGVLANLQSFENNLSGNRNGTFVYPNLAALAANQPQSFTRTLNPQVRTGNITNLAAWLGDTWRFGNTLALVYGARVERSTMGDAPGLNVPLQQALGVRTDLLPVDTRLSPRIGFTLFVPGGKDAPPWGTIRGGIGEFRGTIPSNLLTAALGGTGLPGAEATLTCIGGAAPQPDWATYATNPGAIPTSCVGGVVPPLQFSSSLPSIVAFDSAFSAPRTVRGSLGITRRLITGLNLTLDASYTRGVAQTGFRDVNLQQTPAFTLANEGNRPVFAPAGAYVPTTGAVSLAASRLNPSFGQVLLTTSDLESETWLGTVSIGGLVGKGALVNLSYTYQRSRDQSSFAGFGGAFGFQSATTAGNPNTREWFTSDNERRHQIVGTLTYPFSPAIELTTTVRMLAGTPYTPVVQGDINGDGGSRNDRAFVFDPATVTDPTLKAALQQLYASEAGQCLVSQVGAVAGRNTCVGPWQPALDLQLNWRPNFAGLDRRLSFSVVTQNLMGGLDQLINGADNLKGWGGSVRPDPVLLQVRGFNPATQQFVYQVNQKFGAPTSNLSTFRVPFQIGFQVRFVIGTDPTRDRLLAAFGGGGGAGGAGGPGGGPGGPPGGGGFFFGGGGGGFGGGGPGGGPGGGGGAGAFRALANPPRFILQSNDSLQLALTDEQKAKLTPLADSLDAAQQALQEKLRKAVQNSGVGGDPAQIFGQFRGEFQARQASTRAALETAKATLTPDQWAKLPEALRNPGAARRQGGPN